MRTVMLFHAAYLVLQFPKAKKIIASDSQTIFTCPQDVSHFYFLLSHRHTHTHTHTHTTNTQTHSLPHIHTPLLTRPPRTNTIVIDILSPSIPPTQTHTHKHTQTNTHTQTHTHKHSLLSTAQ